MKRLCFVILPIMLCVAALAVACVDDSATAKLIESTNKLVVIEATETGGSLEDALKSFKEENAINYEGTVGEFGLYITSINGYVPDVSKNEYYAVYTSLGTYEGATYSSEDFGTFEYDGKTYASALYGVSGLPMIKGEIYIITIATF